MTGRAQHLRRRCSIAAALLSVALLLAACGGPYNTLATTDSVCFRGLPIAKQAVHNRGTLVGVRRVLTETLVQRIKTKLHETDLTLPRSLQTQEETELCAFAFRGEYSPGTVQRATNTEAGRYAVVLVGSKHVRLIAAVVLPGLPQRFRHAHFKP